MSLIQKRMLNAILWLVALAYPVGWLVSEVRWTKVNNPSGRFSNITEYLAQSRQPSRVISVQQNEETFYIAYSPTDFWLSVPSSPAAYVFDGKGQMIEWSVDPGEDQVFQEKWPMSQEEVSVDELARNGVN